jgi:hypothetical protein
MKGRSGRRNSSDFGQTIEVVAPWIGRRVLVRGTDGLMMQSRLMSRKVVCTISLTIVPINLKLSLAHTIADPIRKHVDRFRPFLFDNDGCNSTGGIVVGGHGLCRLWMPHFFEGDAQRVCFFAVVKQGFKFCFSSAGEDFTHDVTQDVDGAVDCEGGRRGGGVVGQINISGGARTPFGDR